jgi:hypothetical protein
VDRRDAGGVDCEFPCGSIGFGAFAYDFIGRVVKDGRFAFEFVWFRVMDGICFYDFIGFGAMHGLAICL